MKSLKRSGLIPGHNFVVIAPLIELNNLKTGLEIFCEVNGTVLLQAVIIWHGKDRMLDFYIDFRMTAFCI